MKEAVRKYVDRLVYWINRIEPADKLYINNYPAKVAVEYICYDGGKHEKESLECEQVYVYGRF